MRQAKITELRDHLRKNPGNGEAWLALAELLFGRTAPAQMIPVIQKVLELLPDNSRGWGMMASLLSRQQGPAAAFEWLQQASGKQRDLLGPRLALGAFLLAKEPEKGKAYLQQVSKEHPGDARALVELASHSYSLGDFDSAAAWYTSACAAEPGCADYLNNLAACKLELKQFRETIDLSTSAIELDPKHASAHVNRADAQRQLGRIDSAVSDYETALSLSPESPAILNKAGACLRLLEKLDAAQSYFEQALQIAPGFSLARLNIGLLEISCLQTEPGRHRIEQVLRDPKLDIDSRHTAEVTLNILSEHQRIMPFLARAIEKNQPQLMHKPLIQAPTALLNPDMDCIRSLEKLAAACNKLDTSPGSFSHEAHGNHAGFLEAYSNCKLEDNYQSMAMALDALKNEAKPGTASGGRDLITMYQVLKARKSIPLDGLLDENGESWIRYWHALMMKHHAQAFPGQFKLIPNVISARSPVATVMPEHIPGTLKLVMEKIRPQVVAGISRAIFTKIALVNLHAFKDGNGRLARFVFNWEMESCGLSAIGVSVSYRKHLPRNMDQAILEHKVIPVFEDMLRIYKENQSVLEQFSTFMANRSPD